MYKIVYTRTLPRPLTLCFQKKKRETSPTSLYKDLPRSRTGPFIDLNYSAVFIELVRPVWLTCAAVTSARAVSV